MSLNPVQERLVGEIDEEYREELREEEKIVEALLFAMGRAVSREEIATALGTGPEAAEEAAERLYRSYRERNGGILIRRLEESYQMYTNPAQFEALIRVAKHPKKPVMTDVVMETLAIVAYRQPVTKAEIEKIRGVKSDHAVNRLVEYGLIYEEGRLNAPGRPALFATTEEFLRRFGAESIKDLPALSEEIEASIETEVKEELADALGLSGEEEEAASGEALPPVSSEWEEEIVLSALQEEENEAAASTAFEEKEEAPTPPSFQKEEIPPKAPSEGRDEAKEEANAPHPESGAGAGEEPGPV